VPPFFYTFFAELRRLGYVEGENLLVERRSGEGKAERYAQVAREVVSLKPDAMLVVSARNLAYFREIPIVAVTGDPILFGIVLAFRQAFLGALWTSPWGNSEADGG
jgi:putative ABC transport system substrate-binding protein